MKISKRDLAQLSAYLDGEVSQRDLVKLQKRIDENPVFQAALEDLRIVKSVLPHTPRVKVPRNFSLNRNMVESPQRLPPVMSYRFATAALTILFIGIVVVDIGSGALKGGMLSAQAPMAEEVMLESAADEMEEPSQLVMEKAAEEAAPVAEMEADAEAPEIMEAAREGEAEGMTEGELNLAPEGTDHALGSGEELLGDGSQDPQYTPVPLIEPEYQEPPEDADQEFYSRPETPEIPWLRILEITFGLGAVGFAVAGWRKRKKDQ